MPLFSLLLPPLALFKSEPLARFGKRHNFAVDNHFIYTKVAPMDRKIFMRKAIELAVENVRQGGGPFGAVITRNGEIVATGVNRVTARHDPTAHAEISAIRAACEKLNTFDLSGCEIYTSCEPCPMCLGAIYWAHLDKIYYGCNKDDAAAAGFDDSFIYNELSLSPDRRNKPAEILLPEEAIEAFRAWNVKTDKIAY